MIGILFKKKNIFSLIIFSNFYYILKYFSEALQLISVYVDNLYFGNVKTLSLQ